MLSRENQPFAVACLALMLSFLVLVALHPNAFFRELAGWVQAIGSIAAIWAAYHMGARQAERARMDAADREIQHIAALYHLVCAAETTSKKMLDEFQEGPGWVEKGTMRSRVLSVLRALESVQMASVPHGEVAKALIQTSARLSDLNQLFDATSPSSHHRKRIEEIYSELKDAKADVFRTLTQRALDALARS